MLQESRTEKNYSQLLTKGIAVLSKKGYKQFEADLPPDYEAPPAIKSASSDTSFTPDIRAIKSGQKAYIEISERSGDKDALEKLVTKWKLLARMASIKDGVFAILTPPGTITFTQNLITQYNIEARMIRMDQ